jgi:hypothetical protein
MAFWSTRKTVKGKINRKDKGDLPHWTTLDATFLRDQYRKTTQARKSHNRCVRNHTTCVWAITKPYGLFICSEDSLPSSRRHVVFGHPKQRASVSVGSVLNPRNTQLPPQPCFYTFLHALTFVLCIVYRGQYEPILILIKVCLHRRKKLPNYVPIEIFKI